MQRMSVGIQKKLFDTLCSALSEDCLPGDEPKLSCYSTISRVWQRFVEARTFKDIKVADSELYTFSEVFSEPIRRVYVRDLRLKIVFPSSQTPYVQTPREEVRNNLIFTAAIYELFDELHQWGGHAQSALPYICLTLWAIERNGLGTIESRSRTFLDFDLPPDEPDLALRPVACVKEFSSGSQGVDWTHCLHPSALEKLLASLPKLDTLSVKIDSPEFGRLQLKREHRHALAMAFSNLASSSLTSLTLVNPSQHIANHHVAVATLGNYGDSARDALNIALHRLSQHSPLERLALHGRFVVSSDLFWLSHSALKPSWPRLETIDVTASIMDPHGGYYYTGEPTPAAEGDWGCLDEQLARALERGLPAPLDRDTAEANGSAPVCRWRTRINAQRFDPLLLAMARALPRMPRLSRASFFVNSISGASYFDLSYVRRCEDRVLRVENRPIHSWRAPPDILRLWRELLGPDGQLDCDGVQLEASYVETVGAPTSPTVRYDVA